MTINDVGNVFNCNPWLKANQMEFDGPRWTKLYTILSQMMEGCGVGGKGTGGGGGVGGDSGVMGIMG